MDRVKSNIPFVGLHAHSVAGSPFDGFGYPQDHMDFAYQNGCDALALTDHGNANGLSYQVLHAQKMQKEGKDFKPIFGVEAYFIESLDNWRTLYEEEKQNKKTRRSKKKADAGISAEADGESKQKAKSVLNKRRHLVLLAQNQTGLNNIFKLISTSFQEENFYRYPRMDYDLLEKYNEGIIASSACLGGVYAGNYWDNRESGADAVLAAMRKTTEKMMSVFGDRWYGELQWNDVPEQHELNKYIIQMKDEFGIQLISTADSHYPDKDAWKDRELYKRLGWIGSKRPEWLTNQLPIDVDEIGYELYPKNGDEMWQSYKKYSEKCGVEYDEDTVLDSIKRTHHIAHERIEAFMPDSTVRLPEFVVPDGMSATQALTKEAVSGLRKLGLTDDEHINQLRHELEVINERGFAKYFLTMKAIADKASEMMLCDPGRGSAAGALTSYCLGITQLDPLKYGLMFSRFLRRDAKDYPDIDYDVSDRIRLVDKLVEDWGKTTVVPISNYNKLQPASLLKDIAKFYDIPFTEVNKVSSKMEKEAMPQAKKRVGMKAGMYKCDWQDLLDFSTSLQDFLKKHPQVGERIKNLIGQVRSTGRHAGGVVIGEDLDKYMPLISCKGVTQTPWSEGQNVRHLEPMGFIKFDILGISSLAMIEKCIERILKRAGKGHEFKDVKEFYDTHLHPDVMDLEDQNVYENVFHNGKFLGTFQFTNEGAQKFCMKAKPKNIIDISAITSIYRPGPLSAKVDKDFIKAKDNPESVQYLHEVHKEVTEETYGFLIFQEQIAMLANKLGKDIPEDDAQLLRKLLTKKGSDKGADKKLAIREKFVKGCEEKDISKENAVDLWEKFEYFSGYGFNKSHAISYSILSYQCAWLFNYHPVEWAAAFLDKEPEDRKEKAISLVKNYGFEIEPVDINVSSYSWEVVDDNTLIQPLSSIKGMGDKAIEQLVNNRPFKTIEELIFNDNIRYAKLNKKALDVLCRSGAMDKLVDDRFTGRKHFWSACIVDRPKTKKKFESNIEEYRDEGDFSTAEIVDYVSTLTGIYPYDMVIDGQLLSRLKRKRIQPLGAWSKADSGFAWFIPRELIIKKTAKGRSYLILSVIDTTSTLTKIKCWGYNEATDVVYLNRPYMAKVEYSDTWGFSLKNISKNMRLLNG